jgi:hypothetical protein
MAFGKTTEQILAEEFPGKTKEQIKEMLASFDAIKAKADKLDTTEASLSNITGELAQTKTKLLEIEAGKRTQQTQTTTTVERPDWSEDADAAFNDRVKPLVGMSLSLQAEVIYDRVVNKLEREDPYFPKLRKEFDEMLTKDTNLANKASQVYVENCYNVVFARHRNEIMRDVKAGSGEYFVETGRGQGNNQTLDSNNRPDPTKTLTEEEKREAAKFGLTPEKWMETRNKIKFVGGTIQTM